MNPWYETVNQLEAKQEAYVLITVLGTRGSTPRNSGAKMIVTADNYYNTIGGGQLEFRATALALEMLKEPEAQQKIEHLPLGPKLSQCCGGNATLLFESFLGTELNIMLFGAGHVGKALAGILAQLPCRLHWVDSRNEEFPSELPANTVKIVSETPADEVTKMPVESYCIVMTHSHPLDFDITKAALNRGDARYVGLIGSMTKWRRFQVRFEQLQYSPEFYADVRCPVGLSNVPGKLPIEVAVSVAGEIIADFNSTHPPHPTQQGVSWPDIKNLLQSSSAPAISKEEHQAGEKLKS